jgi:dethiobiotin synthetase
MNLPPFDLGLPALFVTGTDTDVGKTIVVGALAAAAHQCGVRVGVMKPVESGCPSRDGRLVPRDAIFTRELAGCTAPLEIVNPYALQHPLAPALAAEIELVAIDLNRIEQCFRTLAAEYQPLIVEGAGGLLTPLSGGLTMRDLAAALRLPTLIVARNSLGAINHVTLTVEGARKAGLDVVGVVLNRPTIGDDEATRTNPTSVPRWSGVPLIWEMPYLASLDRGTLAVHGIQLAARIAASRVRIQIQHVRASMRRRRGGRRG